MNIADLVCHPSCEECGGSVVVPNFAIQEEMICPNARPYSIVGRVRFAVMRGWWSFRHRARLAWLRRPAWMHRWWWTGEVPF